MAMRSLILSFILLASIGSLSVGTPLGSQISKISNLGLIRGGQSIENECEGGVCELPKSKKVKTKKTKKVKSKQSDWSRFVQILKDKSKEKNLLRDIFDKVKNRFSSLSRFWFQSQNNKSKHKNKSKNKISNVVPKLLIRKRNNSRTSSLLRIQRELHDFQTNPPPNCAISIRNNQLNVWVITLTGVNGTLFEGEKYKVYNH